MGQRSQIFVRYQETDGTRKLVARYYGWNYGECMISRARHTIEWLKENYELISFYAEKIPRILDTNFDMGDCVISSDILKSTRNYMVRRILLTMFCFTGRITTMEDC